MDHLIIIKAEGSGVVVKKVNKAINNNITWFCRGGV